jgi:hypothetical protein
MKLMFSRLTPRIECQYIIKKYFTIESLASLQNRLKTMKRNKEQVRTQDLVKSEHKL